MFRLFAVALCLLFVRVFFGWSFWPHTERPLLTVTGHVEVHPFWADEPAPSVAVAKR